MESSELLAVRENRHFASVLRWVRRRVIRIALGIIVSLFPYKVNIFNDENIQLQIASVIDYGDDEMIAAGLEVVVGQHSVVVVVAARCSS